MRQPLSLTLLAILALSISINAAKASDVATAPRDVTQQEVADLNKGIAQFNARTYKEAFDTFLPICKAHPTFLEPHVMCGAALVKLGNPNEALTYLLKAEQINPNDNLTLFNLGTAYMLLSQREESIERFQKYLKLYPNDTYANEAQARIDILKTEQARNKGITNSKGLDNYLDEATALGAMRWDFKQMPIAVYIAPGGQAKGYKPEFQQFLKDAFASWADASQGKISFKYTDNPDEALITCEWVDSPAQLVNPAEGGEAMPMAGLNGLMMKGSIKLLTHKDPLPALPDGLVKAVALHEVGHILGMLGHSSQPEDIMVAAASECTDKPLSARDKKTIFLLYSAPNTIFAERPVKLTNMGYQGSQSSPKNRAINLNAEALQAIEKHNYDEAIKLLDEAVKLAPDVDIIYVNLAKAYNELGKNALHSQNAKAAQKYLELSVHNLIKGKRKDLALQYCNFLIQLAQREDNATNLKKYQDLQHQLIKTN